MKSQKTIIALALIVAVLALGVAYAAITNQTLTIEGSAEAEVSDANFDVKFVEPTTTGGEGTTVASLDSTDSTGRKATMTVTGLTTKGQKATATYTIQNASPADVSANLSVDVAYDNTTWYKVTPTLVSNTLGKGETTTVTVEVELLDTPATDADVEAAKETFVVTIDAEAQ